MHGQTTPRAHVLALTLLLLVALATPSCALLPKPKSDPTPTGGGAKVTPASNADEASETVEPVEVQLLDSAGLKDLGAQNATIVDIRAKSDFDLEHLPDAINVPMTDFTKKAEKWPVDEPVVVYGSGDSKAQTASAWLVRNGYERVYRLEGGIEDYDGTREGPLGKYRLDKPTLIYIYNDTAFPLSKKITPEVEKLEKEYGKKVDFELIDPLTWQPTDGGDVVESMDMEGVPTPIIVQIPTFFLIESDPRTYRKVSGLDGLRVLYSWLQER